MRIVVIDDGQERPARGDERDLARDGLRVGELEGRRPSLTGTHPLAWHQHQDVAAKPGNLLCDLLRGARSQGHHDDHGGDADDDAELSDPD